MVYVLLVKLDNMIIIFHTMSLCFRRLPFNHPRKTNRILSRNHSTFACRFLHLSSPLPRFLVSQLLKFLFVFTDSLFFGADGPFPYEKRGRPEIRTFATSELAYKADANPQDHDALAELRIQFVSIKTKLKFSISFSKKPGERKSLQTIQL